MRFRFKSLRWKFIVSFILVIIPLIGLLFYITFYGINVIYSQVSKSNQSLLSLYIDQIDETIVKTSDYMYRTIAFNNDLQSIVNFDYGEKDYILTKMAIQNNFHEDIELYHVVDSFFTYIKKYDDFVATSRWFTNEFQDEREERITNLVTKNAINTWQMISIEGKNSLVRVEDVGASLYVGAWINIDTLMQKLDSVTGSERIVALVSKDGLPLSKNNSDVLISLFGKGKPKLDEPYQVITNAEDNQKYLVVSKPFSHSDMYLVMITPDEALLQAFIEFETVLYFVPAIIILILLAYYMILQRVLMKPMGTIRKGMVQVSQGDLDVRLENNETSEFSFLVHTFNNMVGEIQNLKINVYEEKIKSQEAEYKHLQVQINPHFYMNTLNIIYNLAALKDYKTVQKMSIYLAEYFRFIMKTNRMSITISEEITHIRNYLEIQQLRYPELLTYGIAVDASYEQCLIPPLTVQTFVENCIIHGLSKKENGKFTIDIKLTPDLADPEHFFILEVADNGDGFPEEMLGRLRDNLNFYRENDEHVGISNVNDRLLIKFGQEVGITFLNGENRGAVVRLRLPVTLASERNDEHV